MSALGVLGSLARFAAELALDEWRLSQRRRSAALAYANGPTAVTVVCDRCHRAVPASAEMMAAHRRACTGEVNK